MSKNYDISFSYTSMKYLIVVAQAKREQACSVTMPQTVANEENANSIPIFMSSKRRKPYLSLSFMAGSASIVPLFPLTRVRRTMKLDRDIIKVNCDILRVVNITTESFLELMAEAALRFSMEKKHKTIILEHVVTVIS
ncbi:hypothetical protein KI387_018542, partial [Taxus chinensis]